MRYAVIFIIIVIAGCQPGKKNVDCVPPALEYYFRGFDSAELRLITIAKFHRGSNFQNAYDTIYGSSSQTLLSSNSDTLPIAYLGIHQDVDHLVIMSTANNRVYRIRDVELGNETQTLDWFSAVDENCTLSSSLYVDDSLISFTSTPPTSSIQRNSIVLRK